MVDNDYETDYLEICVVKMFTLRSPIRFRDTGLLLRCKHGFAACVHRDKNWFIGWMSTAKSSQVFVYSDLLWHKRRANLAFSDSFPTNSRDTCFANCAICFAHVYCIYFEASPD